MEKKIVIVDDKITVAKMLQIYIADLYQSIYFDRVDKAIYWLENGGEADLILSDFNMPVKNGVDFLRYVKGSKILGTIPFVILSCDDSSTQKSDLLKAGADDYISKPFSPKELKARIRKFLL